MSPRIVAAVGRPFGFGPAAGAAKMLTQLGAQSQNSPPDSSDEAKRLFLNCLATTGLRLSRSKITDSTVNELAAKKPVYHHR